MRLTLVWPAVLLLVAACAVTPDQQGAGQGAATHASVVAVAKTASPTGSPAGSVAGAGEKRRLAPGPAMRLVWFYGLKPGVYPVHLHSICSGAPGFHLAYLPSLHVSSAASGAVAVPAADFGHSWCVIVYANPGLTSVLAPRRI